MSPYQDGTVPALAYPELTDFSAQANSVPMIIEGKAVDFTPSDVQVFNANVWADSDHLMLAACNSSKAAQEVSIRIDRRVLESYGQDGQKELTFKVFDGAGSRDRDDGRC